MKTGGPGMYPIMADLARRPGYPRCAENTCNVFILQSLWRRCFHLPGRPVCRPSEGDRRESAALHLTFLSGLRGHGLVLDHVAIHEFRKFRLQRSPRPVTLL